MNSLRFLNDHGVKYFAIYIYIYIYICIYMDRGGTVVKVLCYNSEGLWFDPSWCHWNFSLT